MRDADFVRTLEHSMAWIGAVGVGKTTALSLLTNLVVAGKAGQATPVFPASGGRTTTSEVVIRTAPAYAISVEPKSEDEIRLLVAEMVSALSGKGGGISTELDRAIRNMADIRKERDPENPKVLIDPVRVRLAQGEIADEDMVEEIVNAMKLDLRTETQMILSETSTNGMNWIGDNVTAINYGKHQKFSIPQRVTVFVPPGVMRDSPFELSIIDTKGVNGTTERADLQALTTDSRTLCILCSSFNDAPSAEPMKLLKSLKDVGSDAFERQRIVLLVLPRGDEAMKIVDDNGEPPESLELALAIRASQVRDTLSEAGLPSVPVLFFNAMAEQSEAVWDEMCGHLGVLRSRQLDRLRRSIILADDLINNADSAKLQQARQSVSIEVKAISRDYSKLPGVVRAAHRTLLSELNSGHPSSIAASVTRRGIWDNFDAHHMIGIGVRQDANLRTHDLWNRIIGRIEALESRFSAVPEVSGLLETLREDISDWRQEFLTRSYSIGRNTFKPYLDGAEDFWSDLGSRYGEGPGYRRDVAGMVSEWFENTTKLNEARGKVDSRLKEAWRELVLDRLIAETDLSKEELVSH